MVTFIADCMLGKLAKWLRILGFDVLYFSKIEDSELVRIAVRDGRVLLTRDTKLAGRARTVRTLFILSEKWEDQVRQVLDVFSLRDEAALHSRCIACNIALKPLSRERVRNLVAPFVLERGREFALCPGCGRVYWKGSHAVDMEARLDALLRAEPKRSGVRKKSG
jgi:uncharacterized protein with PIN domain